MLFPVPLSGTKLDGYITERAFFTPLKLTRIALRTEFSMRAKAGGFRVAQDAIGENSRHRQKSCLPPPGRELNYRLFSGYRWLERKTASMRVLVTGGAGYIGSVIVAQLVAAGHQVAVYDNLSKGHREFLPPAARLVVGDVGDRSLLDAAFGDFQPEAVMHFAAWIEAGESMRDPAKFFRNNTANALTLLETVLAHKVRCFVFSSTAALYGDPESTPIRESDRLLPTNAYGESKLLVEQMLAWFHRIHGLSYASLRYFNAAGATETLGERHDPESHLIPIILQVANGERSHISIFGDDYATPDGTCVRDYVHVSDLASAHLLALEALRARQEPTRLIYNLGNGLGFSVKEVIECARRITGHPIPAIIEPRRAGDPAILVASSEKIRAELGWKPQYAELEDIIRTAWHYLQRHPQQSSHLGA
jgi:UDP-glucose 4-epimerase